MKQSLKRGSLMIREDQHKTLTDKGLNASGLFRDLLDDYLLEYKITISVSQETKDIYDTIISNTASSDEDLEKYLRDSLKSLLKEKIDYMMDIHSEWRRQSKSYTELPKKEELLFGLLEILLLMDQKL